MSDYARTATIRRPADEVYEFLSDVKNLPQYFEAMQSAELAGDADGEAVHVVAIVEGTRREGEAWLRRDAGSRRLQWGSEGPNDYHGELAVTPVGEADSEVTVSLRTERADGPGISAGLETTLANLKRILDGSSTEPA